MRYAVISLLFLCVWNASAQDDAVLVEAPRFREEVRRLPASVTVIRAADIERSPARTLPELLNENVGFSVKDLFGNNAASTALDLRGFGATGPQNTLILLDGRRLNDFDLSGVQWSAIPLAGIERIEALRGTGSVLYGDGASSGVVNIVTRSPLGPGRSLEVLGRVASFDIVEGQVYGGIATERLGFNASLYGYQSDGYRQNNRNEQKNSTLNARWALGAGSVDLRLGTDRQDLRLPGGRFVQPSIGLDETTDPRGTSTPLDYASRDGARAGISLDQGWGAAQFLVGLDRREKDQRSYFDFGGFPSYRDDHLELTSLTPRVRLTAGSHTLVAGVDWHEWRYSSERTDRPENIAQPANRATVTQDTEGVYLQDTIGLARGTFATLGWRRERARYRGTDEPCPSCLGATAVAETQKEDAWEAGLRHDLAPSWSVFARAGKSFRFVNAEEVYESDPFFAPQFQILRPQTARINEAGLEWRRGPIAARAVLFRTEVTDEIHLDPFTTGVGNTNLPPSRRQGVELEGRLAARPGLRLTAAYAYTDAKFLEGTLAGSPFAIGTGLSIEGRTVPLVPRHKLNLGLVWDAAPATQLSGVLTALSEQVLDNDEPNTLAHRIPAYYVVDVKLAQRFSWGRLSASVNNLFDEDYYTYAVRSAFTPDRYAVYPLPGRSFALTAELKLN